MKVLVAGAAGMIGSNLVKHLLTKPEVELVFGIDDLSGGYIENLPENNKKFQFYQIDAADPRIDYIFKSNNIDVLYNTAAWAAEGASPWARRHTVHTNAMVGANLINMAIEYNVGRFIQFSSMASYGNGVVPFDEDAPLNPIDSYGIYKVAVEKDLAVANIQHGLPYVILVPHNVYSSIGGQIIDRFRNVLTLWMARTLSGKTIQIFGDGLQERAFTDCVDILEPMWVAGTSSKPLGHRINLGGITPVTIKYAAELCKDVMGKGEIEYVEPRHEVKYAYSTYQKSVDLLGFKHTVELEQGLPGLWEWVQKMHPLKQMKEHPLEITKGLYSYWK